MTHNKFIVFSDLDGTLLDHRTYSFEPARPALEKLKSAGHVLVLASSKTAAEIAPLRREMGFADCPAIVENGAGLLEPGDDGSEPEGKEHQRIITALDQISPHLRRCFSGFSDWSVGQVMDRTGLPEQSARQAKLRRFSEPGVWTGSDGELDEFLGILSAAGISAMMGGRFLTLSHGKTKASQIDAILSRNQPKSPRVTTIALGDAPNDVAMLEKADRGVIIANPAHAGIGPLPGEKTGRIIRSNRYGPVGWNEEVLRLLDEY